MLVGTLRKSVFFTSGQTTVSLWQTNGTAAGTVKLKDLDTQLECMGSDRTCSINFQGALYFYTSDFMPLSLNAPHETQSIWRTDGTADGTSIIYNGPANLGPVVNRRLLFMADAGDGYGLEIHAIIPNGVSLYLPLTMK